MKANVWSICFICVHCIYSTIADINVTINDNFTQTPQTNRVDRDNSKSHNALDIVMTTVRSDRSNISRWKSPITEAKDSVSTFTANGINDGVQYDTSALNNTTIISQSNYDGTRSPEGDVLELIFNLTGNHTDKNHAFSSHSTAQKIGIIVVVVVVAIVVAVIVAFICYRKRLCCGRYTVNHMTDTKKKTPSETSSIQTGYEDLNKGNTSHHNYSTLNQQPISTVPFSNNGFEKSGEYLEPVKANDLYESIKIEEQQTQVFFHDPQREAKLDSECYVDINDDRLYTSVN